MKHVYVYLLSIILLTGSLTALAQNNEQEAFQKFKQAREAYDAKNYSDAANLLIETKKLLGSTNVRIQPMLIKSLVAIEDWNRAAREVDNYYALDPDKELVEYLEIGEIERQISLRVRADEELYQAVLSNKSIIQMESYLSEFPFGLYRTEVSTLITTQQEENAWTTAKTEHNTRAYETYLAKYPGGLYADEARTTIARWDLEAFNTAKETDSQVSLTSYLQNYPRGSYRNEAEKLLINRVEEDAFAATSSGKLDDFERYVQLYPYGKYADVVNRAIEEWMFKKAEEAYQNSYYSIAERDYSAYLNRYPDAENAEKAKQMLKRAKAKASQFSSSYTGFTYEPGTLLGLKFGGLNKDRIGYYLNIRITPAFFSTQFEKPEIEYIEGTEPDDAKLAAGSLSLGLSYPVAYPLWVYAGGGVNYQERFSTIDGDKVFYRLAGEKSLAFFPELGLKVRPIKAITIIAGGSYLREKLLYKVGIGFDF